ncbi:MAG: molybdate ABC transporter permease subunit, partial [Actinomycetota bacterium]|nr:molybdate ABC transporter permease subunit [Actinomycetota bacterium]
MRRTFDLLLALAVGIVLAFLLLPVTALFLRLPPETLLDALASDVALDALRVTLQTGLVAHALVLLLGTPAAYFLGTRRFRGRGLVVTAIELPLVLPPAVAGIALLTLFGRRGLLGGAVEAAGLEIAFT